MVLLFGYNFYSGILCIHRRSLLLISFGIKMTKYFFYVMRCLLQNKITSFVNIVKIHVFYGSLLGVIFSCKSITIHLGEFNIKNSKTNNKFGRKSPRNKTFKQYKGVSSFYYVACNNVLI